MPCGCAQAPLGSSEERPITAGPANGAPPQQFRLLMNMGFASYGDIVWVTGAAVDIWVDKDRLEPYEG